MALGLVRTVPPRIRSAVVILLAAAFVASCSGSSPTASPAAPTTSSAASASPSAAASSTPPSASPSASPVASSAAPSASAGASGVATSIDPCQVVTQDEASKLAGASFGAGKESTNSGGGRMCTYGGQTQNVFMVLVGQATDPAAAQADWTQEQSRAEASLKQGLPAGVNLNLKLNDTTVAGADRAATATLKESISGIAIEVSAIYLLKGATFLSFSDLAVGHSAPTAADMEAQAQTSLGRLP